MLDKLDVMDKHYDRKYQEIVCRAMIFSNIYPSTTKSADKTDSSDSDKYSESWQAIVDNK